MQILESDLVKGNLFAAFNPFHLIVSVCCVVTAKEFKLLFLTIRTNMQVISWKKVMKGNDSWCPQSDNSVKSKQQEEEKEN